jgi:Bacterial translation initiation factor IF-2 associated region
MSNDQDDVGEKKVPVAPVKGSLTLKRGVEQGLVRPSLSHGRTKAVVVEKVKRRAVGPAVVVQEAASKPKPSGVVLRALTDTELEARGEALQRARIAELRNRERNRIAETDRRHKAFREAIYRQNDRGAAEAEANRRIRTALIGEAHALYLAELGGLEIIPSLSDLPKLTALSLAWTRISDLSPISNLMNLTSLNLCCTQVSNLGPISRLKNLQVLILRGTEVEDISSLGALNKLRVLDLEDTRVTHLHSIAGLTNLEVLDVRSTKIFDISPISQLRKLTTLRVSDTKVSDILPAIGLSGLAAGAQADEYYGGLSFVGCPLADEKLVELELNPNPGRTIETISYLRRAAETRDEEGPEDEDKSQLNPQPVENVPSPFSFRLSVNGTIGLDSSPVNWPAFPSQRSEKEHGKRLDVCRALAEDLLSDLAEQKYQVRMEYGGSLKRYESRLPTNSGDGNILLADAEARTLRNLFFADANMLPAGFASQLKTFLEQHMGLRVFYPEIVHFYRDVQSGRLETPLPLDVVEEFVEAVRNNTPSVFEPAVTDAINEASAPAPAIAAIPPEDLPPADPNQPMPPNDPLGEVDVYRARDFTVAGVANSLWRIYLAGEKVYKALEGWTKAGDALRPPMRVILQWLSSFGGPPLPPT